MHCLLCGFLETRPVPFIKETRTYHDCVSCGFRFLDPIHRLKAEEEKERYGLHVFDPDQAGYRAYSSPLVELITGAHAPGARGLDYGAGPDSAAYRMLLEKGFSNIARYDRFFFPDEALLTDARFDFIYACEVVEHFHDPGFGFARLHALLKPGGTITLMTSLLTVATDFENWHYRRDPTHVGFFSSSALNALAKKLNFQDLQIHGSRTITMRRRLHDTNKQTKENK